MKINISELFKYRQYKDAPVYYCFDKKEYKVCNVSIVTTEADTPYQRYLSLLQIDEKAIQDNYIKSLNNKYISRDYQETDLHFNAFIDYQGLQSDWWKYYTRMVFDLEKIWCEVNNIKYVYDL